MALLTEGEAILTEGASHLLAGSINMDLLTEDVPKTFRLGF